MYQNILVAVDDSAKSRLAFKSAVETAERSMQINTLPY